MKRRARHTLQGDVVRKPGDLEGDTILPTDIPVPTQPAKKKTFFKECVVAGWNFHDLADTWDELHEGAELVLIRDRKNKYDKNAVAVALADDYDGNPDDFDFDFILGYVPRKENEMIAKMMDMGWSDAFTAELTTVNDHGAYANRLRMTIYIQSKDEFDEANSERVYAVRLDKDEYAEMKAALICQGFVYKRWGGFPIWERQLPKVGDKLIFITEKSDKVVLFLMRVMADEEDRAGFFIDNPDELLQIDDCCPFILTNIMGPIVLLQEEIRWFDLENIDKDTPEQPLAQEVAQRLLEIINQKPI